MININQYISEKLIINKDSKVKPESELSDVISVISCNSMKPSIAVCTIKNDIISMAYPLVIGKTEIECGSSGRTITNNNVKIRPATIEEIKQWRNALGPAQSARKTANTVEKVKEIKWVASALRLGKKIINHLEP